MLMFIVNAIKSFGQLSQK